MSLLRWPGAKSRLLEQILPHLDLHLSESTEFHDVFLGGGSVLVDVATRYPRMRLHGNDRDPGIAALWSVITGPERGRLQEVVRATTPTLALWDEWKTCVPTDDLEAAFQVLYLNRTSYSGIVPGGPLGGRHQTGKTEIGSRWNPVRLCSEIERLHHLLHGRFEIHCEDATSYLGGLIWKDDALAYIDPPYHSVGNQLYRVGMTPDEHRALAARVRDLPRWVASYDDVPEIHDLYRWAQRLAVTATYTTARAKGQRARRQELVIVPEGHPTRWTTTPLPLAAAGAGSASMGEPETT